MKLIVGLGNTGKEYESSRHNIGFMVVDFLNKKFKGNFRFDKKTEAEISQIKIEKIKVVLAKPQVFVNNSGKTVKKLMRILKIKPKDLIVIHDDLDIPFGKVKNSFAKNSAGHKGVQSIINSLKSNKFYRVRIGILSNLLKRIKKIKSKKKKISEINNFVISSFRGNEKKDLRKIIKSAAERVEQLA